VIDVHDMDFTEGRPMSDERTTIGRGELGRWLLVAILVVVGVVLYFKFAPDSRPVALPSTEEAP
jgi:hypothetical protein